MEAGSFLHRTLLGSMAMLCVAFSSVSADAANQRTRNFIVDAPNQQLANAVAEAAEKYRKELAVYWLGNPLEPWPAPCPIRVKAGPNLAAQGVTTYNPRPVRDFQMEVIGTPQRILDSVLPHEVTHTILATHFGRPLPRWADEGICTTVEHSSERNKHEVKLREFLRSRRGIAMNQLFLMTEYPSDILPMYAQGYSVCRFLIDQKGPRNFIQFLHDYMQHPSWTANVKEHYGYDSLKELQEYWLAWVSEGSQSTEKFAKTRPTPADDRAALALNGAGGKPVPRPEASPESLPATAGEPDATALVSLDSMGWYQRKKREAQSGQRSTAPSPNASSATGPAAAPNASGPIAPPSVRQSGPYSSAHPQPVQTAGGISPLPASSGSRRF